MLYDEHSLSISIYRIWTGCFYINDPNAVQILEEKKKCLMRIVE